MVTMAEDVVPVVLAPQWLTGRVISTFGRCGSSFLCGWRGKEFISSPIIVHPPMLLCVILSAFWDSSRCGFLLILFDSLKLVSFLQYPS